MRRGKVGFVMTWHIIKIEKGKFRKTVGLHYFLRDVLF
jgi:hypothetical protein